MSFSDSDVPFIVDTDASCISPGTFLAQKKAEGKVPPLQFASRTKTSAEKKYSTCERKTLGIIFALKKVRACFLSSISVTVITDQKALRYIFQENNAYGRLAQLLVFLAEHDFKIDYRPGKMSAPAGYLSRLDLGSPVEPGCSKVDLAGTTVYTEDFQNCSLLQLTMPST